MTQTSGDQNLSVGSAVKNFLAGLRGGYSTASSATGAEDQFFSDLMAAAQKYEADRPVERKTQQETQVKETPTRAVSSDETTDKTSGADDNEKVAYAQRYKDDRLEDREERKCERAEAKIEAKSSVDAGEQKATADKSDKDQEEDLVTEGAVAEEAVLDVAQEATEGGLVEIILSTEAQKTAAEGEAAIDEDVDMSDCETDEANKGDIEKAMLLFFQGLQARQALEPEKVQETKAETEGAAETTDMIQAQQTPTEMQTQLLKPTANNKKTDLTDAAETTDSLVADAQPTETQALPQEQRGAVKRHDAFLALIKDAQGVETGADVSSSAPTPSATVLAAATGNATKTNAAPANLGAESGVGTAKIEMTASPLGVDNAHKTGATNATTHASATRGTYSNAATFQSAVEQVSLFLNRYAKMGQGDQLTLQLRPAELGRIDVKLTISADQQVQGVVYADNQATLDLLSQDSSALERALQNAGLQADAGCMQFSLRGDGQSAFSRQDGNASASGNALGLDDQDSSALADLAVAQEAYYITPERVNLRV